METILFRDIWLDDSEDALLAFIVGKSILDDDEDLKMIHRMAKDAMSIASPKAVCCIAEITARSSDWIEIEGIRITSPLVMHNLENTHRVFPYIATCGTELEAWSHNFSDPLEQYWADQVKLFYLGKIRSYMSDQIRKRFFPVGHMSSMNPGSLKEWPLTQQAVLFRILGNGAEDIGVALTDSFLMLPSKSSSGFFFSSKEAYENCQFCPILNCPGRRAPYKE